MKLARNTSVTSEGKANPKTESKQQKKELHEQQSARVAFKSRKELSGKPITPSKNEKNDYNKAPSTSKHMSKSTPSISVSVAEEVKAKSLDVSITNSFLSFYKESDLRYAFRVL